MNETGKNKNSKKDNKKLFVILAIVIAVVSQNKIR